MSAAQGTAAEQEAATGREAPGRVVVGVDGSAGSLAALAWAGDHARRLGLRVVVVRAYTDATPAATAWPPVPVLSSATEVEAEARAELARSVDQAVDPSVPVEQRVVRSEASRALTDAVDADDLLVVGHRQGLAGALGSVARRVVAHAPCPVVVVPQR